MTFSSDQTDSFGTSCPGGGSSICDCNLARSFSSRLRTSQNQIQLKNRSGGRSSGSKPWVTASPSSSDQFVIAVAASRATAK